MAPGAPAHRAVRPLEAHIAHRLAGRTGLKRVLGVGEDGELFARGLAQGLVAGALSATIMTFSRQLCRPRGVAIAHFGSGC